MSTKELVERLRAHTEVVDMYGTLRAVDVCLDAADTIERLERERDEAHELVRSSQVFIFTGYEMRLATEAAEAEADTLRARVERLEDAMRIIRRLDAALTEEQP